MRLAARKGSFLIHGDVFGRTLCGWPTQHWDILADHGSLHSITCKTCVRVLVASGDLKLEARS